MHLPSDEELFASFQRQRDCQALAVLFHRRADELLRIAVFLAPRPTDAEDLVQATFLSAIAHADRFRPGHSVVNWLSGILANHARMLHRAQGRVVPVAVQRDDVVDPEQETLRRELRAALDHALASLAEPYRSVARLHLQTGLDSGEIGARLQCAPATARKRLERALSHLRRLLPLGLATAVVVRLSPAQLAARAADAARAAAATAPFVAAAAARPAARAVRWYWPAAAGVALAALLTLALSARVPALLADEALAGAQRARSADRTEGAVVDAAPAARALPAAAADAAPPAPLLPLGVRARWLDGTPAAGVALRLLPAGGEPDAATALPRGPIATTDGAGLATFTAARGRYDVLPIAGLPLGSAMLPADGELAVTLD